MTISPDFRHSRSIEGAFTLELRGGISHEVLHAVRTLEYGRVIIHPGDWPSLRFLLDERDRIRELIVRAECDWKTVGSMSQLRRLTIGGWFSAPLDFARLSFLEELDTYWNKGYMDSVYSLPNLRKLRIVGWKSHDCMKLQTLKSLESLALVQASCASLEGVGGVERLATIQLTGLAKLLDAVSLADAQNLTHIRLEKAKHIKSWDFLCKLRSVRDLELPDDGTMPSVKCAARLRYMRSFRLGSTMVGDGDLRVLANAPSLQQCFFKNMKHYNITQEEMTALLEARFPQEAATRRADERRLAAESEARDRALYASGYGPNRDKWWSEITRGKKA